MTSFFYDPAVYEGTNASLTSAVSSDGWPETGKRYRHHGYPCLENQGSYARQPAKTK